MRRALPILCLLLAACDRNERGNYDASRSSKSSERSAAPATSNRPTQRPAPPLTPEEEAVMNDPEARRLRMRYQEAYLDYQNFPKKGEDPIFKSATQELAAYYAAHHPAAGFAWMRAQPNNIAHSPYAAEFYRINPDDAIRGIRSQTDAGDRFHYTMGLAECVSPADLERVWKIVIDPAMETENTRELIERVNGAWAALDPEAAWEKWQSEVGDPADVAGFLDSISPLKPGVIYPTHLLDRVPEDQRAEAVTDAFIACQRANLDPLKAWLSAQPANPRYDGTYHIMAQWMAYQGDPAEAARWIDRITDVDAQQSARSDAREAEELRKTEE